MIRNLLGLIMVLLISCNSRTENNPYFKDKDFKNIIDKIIERNYDQDEQKILVVNIEDYKDRTEIVFFLYESIDNCKDVKLCFEYRGFNIVLVDNSKSIDFNQFITVNKVKNCKDLINESINIQDRTDYKAYFFMYDKNKIKYGNTKELIYNNGILDLFGPEN